MIAAFARGPKQGDACIFQRVHAAKNQRIVGSDYGIVNFIFCGEGHDIFNVCCADSHTDSILCNAAVAGEGINGFNFRIFLQGADDGVFPATAADDEQIHIVLQICIFGVS